MNGNFNPSAYSTVVYVDHLKRENACILSQPRPTTCALLNR